MRWLRSISGKNILLRIGSFRVLHIKEALIKAVFFKRRVAIKGGSRNGRY